MSLHLEPELLREIARVAALIRDDKIARYPKWVARGAATQDDADADIAAWEHLAADYAFVSDPEVREPGEGGLEWHRRKLAALNLAATRYADRLAKAPRDADGKPPHALREAVAAIELMIQQQHRYPATPAWLAAANRQARKNRVMWSDAA